MSITIFLADDHRVLLEGLRLLLETQADLKVIGMAEDGRDAGPPGDADLPRCRHLGHHHARLERH